jgi:hypothetical protein
MKHKHRPCPCGCGELADECMNPRSALNAFQITDHAAFDRAAQARAKREQHEDWRYWQGFTR